MKTSFACAAFIVALLVPAAARAQGGPGIPTRIAGEEVIVTQSASGAELRGRIVELSRTTLGMLVNGTRVDVPIDNVLRIDARTDSVKNGAMIGGGLMLGSALLTGALVGVRDGTQFAAGTFFNALFGALAGAGIDALHKGRTTIYSKPAGMALSVAPAGKGARLQLALKF
jgi:hypothetical protein